MKLSKDPLERIATGKKNIEVRLFDEKRKLIKIGDIITFQNLENRNMEIITEVTGISKFKSFKDLFTVFGTEPFGHPSSYTVEDQVDGMRDAYSPEQESKHEVVGIHIKLI